MDDFKRGMTAWSKVVNSGFVVTKRAKRLRSPSPHAKKLFKLQSTTFNHRTIVAMIAPAQINRTVDPLQLTETALPQSSPQLAGPSPISLSANGLDNRSQHC